MGHPSRLLVVLTIALLTPCACGGGGDGGPAGTVSSVSAPFHVGGRTLFLVEGSGFLAAGTSARVRFTATLGTPFAGQTSATAIVDARVLSNSQLVGMSPRAAQCEATVAVLLDNGSVLAADSVVARFNAPSILLPGPDDETLTGTPGNDTLDGGPGADTLFGGAGDDLLLGGTGDDGLQGETGHDTLTGGAGSDAYLIDVMGAAYDDVITDYEVVWDVLVIEGVQPTLACLDAFADVSDIGAGGDVIVTWSGGGTLTFEGLGTGAVDNVGDLLSVGVLVLVYQFP